MLKTLLCIIIFYLFAFQGLSQVETIPADHPVYPFLKNMFIKGVLDNYDDVILPLSKQEVINLLKKIELNSNKLTPSEQEFLCRMEVKIGVKEPAGNSYFNNFPDNFFSNYKSYNEKHLYTYSDSTVRFNLDIFGDAGYLYSNKYQDYSLLLNVGGQLYGTYSDWFGYLIEGSNGKQFHNREVAELDPRVKTNFTFNRTGLNFFDDTQGYVRFQKDDVSLQLGRERILWGVGQINKMVLSYNPPIFDFLKFHIQYKSLKYDFLHGWLVQPFDSFFVDTRTQYVRVKNSKYLAISRLGFSPNSNLNFGISQMIIYANRPFEAAYLNPFLFWESAQRSLGDLDNSFLTLDARYKITDGIDTYGTIIFDDIKFGNLFKGEFDQVSNRSAWQTGLMLTNPIIPENVTFKIEYLQIRPYTFSHPDLGESLTYTNNSFILGANIQPNSTGLNSEITYLFNGVLQIGLRYSHILHGNNYYDENGKIIKNVGGDIFINLNLYDSQVAPLLDGLLETTDNVSVSIQYEILYGIYFNLLFNSFNSKTEISSNSENSLYSQIKFYFR